MASIGLFACATTSNEGTLALITFLSDKLEMTVCRYCDRPGDGTEPCEGCAAPPMRKCIGCSWRFRGWCDAPAHLRCPIQRYRRAA